MNKKEMIEAIQKSQPWKSVQWLNGRKKEEAEDIYKSGVECGLIKPITHTIHYCQCGQAVRLRKRDNKWVHYGYKKMHEPYAEFLDRTAHPVEVTESKEWVKE